MRKIVISNIKGGVGKSTLTINLAHALSDNCKVAILDTDTQGTVKELANNLNVYTRMEDVDKDCQILIIDTPPYISEGLADLYLQADFIIFPMQASLPDYTAAVKKTLDIFNQQKNIKPQLKGAILINMNDSRTSLTKAIVDDIKMNYDIPVFKTMIENRVDYKRSVVLEEGIYSLSDKKAHKEFNDFVKEVLTFLI